MINCKAVVAFFIAVLFFPAIAWTNPNPSFDCAKASSFAEVAICSNDELAELDMRMSMAYHDQLAATSNINSARATQRSWIRMREACESRECIKNLYVERITELGGGMVNSKHEQDDEIAMGGGSCFDRSAASAKLYNIPFSGIGYETCFGFISARAIATNDPSALNPNSQKYKEVAANLRGRDTVCYQGEIILQAEGGRLMYYQMSSNPEMAKTSDLLYQYCGAVANSLGAN